MLLLRGTRHRFSESAKNYTRFLFREISSAFCTRTFKHIRVQPIHVHCSVQNFLRLTIIQSPFWTPTNGCVFVHRRCSVCMCVCVILHCGSAAKCMLGERAWQEIYALRSLAIRINPLNDNDKSPNESLNTFTAHPKGTSWFPVSLEYQSESYSRRQSLHMAIAGTAPPLSPSAG